MASTAANAVRRGVKLWVGNIPWTISKHELAAYFSQFGKVQRADVAFSKDTGVSRGYGFVQFQREETMKDVLAKENHILEGRPITVTTSRER